MSTEDGRFDDGPAGPVRIADFDALDALDGPDDVGPPSRVASFDPDDEDPPDDGGRTGDGSDDGVRRAAGSGPVGDAAGGRDDDPAGDVATASAPPSELRTVDLDDGPDAEEPPRTRVVSFEDEPEDGGSDDAGPGRPVRRARFDGTRPTDRPGGGTGRRGSGTGRREDDADRPDPTGSLDRPDRPDRSGGWSDRTGGVRRRRGGPGRTDGPGANGGGTVGGGAAGAAGAGGADRRGSRGGRGGSRTDAGPPPDDETRAREICLRLLTDRARTVKELRDALVRREIPEDVADRVLERFDEVGLVDDEAFAGQWVRSRHRHRGLGRRAIAQELSHKGVAKEIADEALTEIDAESEEARARELVDRKIRSVKVGTREERASASRRLVGMLARKGYGAGVAYSVVREAIAARGAEEDELGEDPPED